MNWRRIVGPGLSIWGGVILIACGLMSWVGVLFGVNKAPPAFAVTWYVILAITALASVAMVIVGIRMTRRYRARNNAA